MVSSLSKSLILCFCPGEESLEVNAYILILNEHYLYMKFQKVQPSSYNYQIYQMTVSSFRLARTIQFSVYFVRHQIYTFQNKIRQLSSMKLSQYITLSPDSRLAKKGYLSSDFSLPTKSQNCKMMTQQSVINRNLINLTEKINKQIAKQQPKLMTEVLKSQSFCNSRGQSKEYLQTEKIVIKPNKGGQYRSALKNAKELGNDILAKRSVQILIGLNKGMFKTQYSKINRRREEVGRKNSIPSQFEKQEAPIHHMQEFSEQKLLEKYRELLQRKQKSRPFNMINKLYQIDFLSAKEALLVPKEGFKPVSTKLNIGNRGNNIEAKVNRFNDKPSENDQVRDMLLSGSQKTIANKTQPQSASKKVRMLSKPLSQQRQNEIKSIRQPQKKRRKQTETEQGLKISIPLRSVDMRIKQHLSQKVPRYPSPIKMQKDVIYPGPKKVASSAYIIYEIINQQKSRCNLKRGQYDFIKKKEYTGKIHTSYNIKTSSEIASLTKIMTCIVIIQICDKFAINSRQQKYKIGCYQSSIRGTSADLQAGQVYTIDQLLHGLMLPSGNDASLALARWGGNILLLNDGQGGKNKNMEKMQKTLIEQQWVAGNKYIRYKQEKLKFRRCYNRFIAEMNKKARLLGLERTTYVNSHGLSNPHNKSCCLDLALLCEYAMKHFYFRSIVICKQFSAVIDKYVQSIENEKSKKISKIKKQKAKNNNDDPEQMNMEEDIEGDSQWNKSENDDEQEDHEQDQLFQSSVSKNEVVIVPQKVIQIVKKQINWTNTHKLVHCRQEYLGIKTGVTTTAGACLSSFLRIGERCFVIIVLNSKKLSMRFIDTQILRRWLSRKENIYHSESKFECLQ